MTAPMSLKYVTLSSEMFTEALLHLSLAVHLLYGSYGKDKAGPCHAGHRVPSEIPGALPAHPEFHHVRRWSSAIQLQAVFGHYGEY